MYKKLLYSKAYRHLNTVTPLKIDCGALCGKACCKGDANTGMFLFPGEEAAYALSRNFLEIKASDFNAAGGTNTLLAVCGEQCNRNLRPLSCRIFPLAPYIRNGRLEVVIDSRAKRICPIAMLGINSVNRLFVKKVRDVFRLLIQDREINSFIEALSRLQDEYELFRL